MKRYGTPNPKYAPGRKNHLAGLALPLVLLVLLSATARAVPSDQTTVKGALTTEHGVPLLRVWGTPYEQGFAHGYLLGPQIMGFVEAVLLNEHIVRDEQTYETLVRGDLLPKMQFGRAPGEELLGMLAGMRAKMGENGLSFRRLHRSLDLLDLKALNTIADWRPAGCSSFAAWGDMTADGQMLVARNLDYLRLPGIDKLHLVVAHVENVQNRKRFMSVGWPGMVGVYTGMNEDGLSVAMHDAPGKKNREAATFVPRSIVLREILETAPESGTTAFVEDLLRRRQTLRGNNFLVASPNLQQANPAAVFEYDGNKQIDSGVTLRLPGNATNLTPSQTIACTNHYRLRGEPTQCRRYEAISKALQAAATDHHRLDCHRALEIIDRASVETTLHSIIAFPSIREIQLHLASPDNRATKNPGHLLKLDEILVRPNR